MFANADEYPDTEAGNSACRFENKKFIGCVRDAICDAFGGRTTADYLWNI